MISCASCCAKSPLAPENVVLKSARINDVVLCTARNIVIKKIDAANAIVGIVWMALLHCAHIAICCAVRRDVRIDWRMALQCARIAICCAAIHMDVQMHWRLVILHGAPIVHKNDKNLKRSNNSNMIWQSVVLCQKYNNLFI